MEDDPFDSLLRLEDEYYKEGYELGTTDGKQAGHIEGRFFGLEKGFAKFLDMGRLQGRSVVWSSRLSRPEPQLKTPDMTHTEPPKASSTSGGAPHPHDDNSSSISLAAAPLLPHLPENVRMEKQLRIFHALVESESISTLNNEEAVSDFDDRLKRAMGKAKIIEKMIGEEVYHVGPHIASGGQVGERSHGPTGNSQDGSIEDVSSLRVRH